MSILPFSHVKSPLKTKQHLATTKPNTGLSSSALMSKVASQTPKFRALVSPNYSRTTLLFPHPRSSVIPKQVGIQTRRISFLNDKIQNAADWVTNKFAPIEWTKDLLVMIHDYTGVHSLVLLTGVALSIRLVIHPLSRSIEKSTMEVMGSPEAAILAKLYKEEKEGLKRTRIRNDLIEIVKKAQRSARTANILLTISQIMLGLTAVLGIRRTAELHPSLFTSLRDFYEILPVDDPSSLLPFTFAVISFLSRNYVFPFAKLSSLPSIPLVMNILFYTFIFCIPMLASSFTLPVLVYWNISSLIGFGVVVLRKYRQTRQIKYFETQTEELRKMMESNTPIVSSNKKLEGNKK